MKAFCDNCGRIRIEKVRKGHRGDGKMLPTRCKCGGTTVTVGFPCLNIPDLGTVILIVRHPNHVGVFYRAGDTSFVTRDMSCGRRDRYTVLKLNHQTGWVTVTGRELPRKLACQVARGLRVKQK